MADEQYYIVRGAQMRCCCGDRQVGTHPRKINLPVSHGVYVNGKPMMNEADHTLDNVPSFGICTGSNQTSTEIIYLISEDGAQTIAGPPCIPKILQKWSNTKQTMLVDGKPALQAESTLYCVNNGKIRFFTTGQEEQ